MGHQVPPNLPTKILNYCYGVIKTYRVRQLYLFSKMLKKKLLVTFSNFFFYLKVQWLPQLAK